MKKAPNTILTVIASCSKRNENTDANKASIDNISAALLAVVCFCAAVCSKYARSVDIKMR